MTKIQCICMLFNFRFFIQTADAYSPLLLMQMLSGAVFISNSYLQMDMAIHKLDTNILLMSIAVFISSWNLFVYCFTACNSTEQYTKLADMLYESNWPKLTVNLQKIIILMILEAQKPIYYHGLSLVELRLGTFMKVLLLLEFSLFCVTNI